MQHVTNIKIHKMQKYRVCMYVVCMHGIITLQRAIRFLCKICEPFLSIKTSSKE